MAIPPVDTSSTRPVQQPLTIGAATNINDHSRVCQLPLEIVLRCIASRGTPSSSLRTSLAATCRYFYHLLQGPDTLQELARLQFPQLTRPLAAGQELQSYERRCLIDCNLSHGVYTSSICGWHPSSIHDLAVLLDGRIVSGSADGTLMICDPTGQAPPVTLQEDASMVCCVAVLLDGRIVSGSADGTLMIWDPTGQALPVILQEHTSAVQYVTVLLDGRILSTSVTGTLPIIWDPTEQAPPVILREYSNGIRCFAVLLDGRIVLGSITDGTLIIWDPTEQRPPVTLQGHAEAVSCVTVLPDGRIVSGYADGTLMIWDPTEQTPPVTLRGHDDLVLCVTVLLDGRILSTSLDGTPIIWDPTEQAPPVILGEGYPEAIHHIYLLSNDRILSTYLDSIIIWDPTGQMPLVTLRGHTAAVSCVAVLPDGNIVSDSHDGTLRVWDFSAPPTKIFEEIAKLLKSADPQIAADAMERFNRMPQAARNHIYGELYLLIQPSLSNDYWGCAEQIFHDRDPQQNATQKQKAKAIHNYVKKCRKYVKKRQ